MQPHRIIQVGVLALSCVGLLGLWGSGAHAQLTDQTRTPNTARRGIALSLSEQIGAGQGEDWTPDSSLYLIARDPARAIRRGRQLCQRKFTVEQGLGPRKHDGIGDIAVFFNYTSGTKIAQDFLP